MNLRLLGQFAKQVRPLLHHQGWLWGWDVRCPEGNRLVAYGFERVPAPVEASDSVTTYRLDTAQYSVVLWSYGIAMYIPAWRDALFLERSTGEVHALTPASFAARIWCYDDLVAQLRAITAETIAMAPSLFRWIGEYESRIQELIGIEARERELAGWKLAIRQAAALPAAWQEIAERWNDCLASCSGALNSEEMEQKPADVDEKGVPEQADAENRRHNHHGVDTVSPLFGPVDILQVKPEREFVER